ncbi:VanZ family protein [Alteribacillus sp. HJP-4]|uniref:VanZ family protein n=1 Tax=Alteribacillus sp. HJP-4 TaxID=2775394 RepID=UPI0035CD0C11
MKRSNLFYLLPLAVWIVMVSSASTMSYEQQDMRPLLSRLPLSVIETPLSGISFTYAYSEISVEELGLAGFVEFFVRKGAHVVTYFGMAVCAVIALRPLRMQWGTKLIWTFLFIVIFASLDEVRHFYHPERTGLWQDVVLDSFGAMLGLLVMDLISKVRGKRTADAGTGQLR